MFSSTEYTKLIDSNEPKTLESFISYLRDYEMEFDCIPFYTQDIVNRVSMTPNKRFLVGGCNSGLIVIWDVALQRVFREFETTQSVISSLLTSLDSQIVISAGDSPDICFWSIEGNSVYPIKELKGHTQGVTALAKTSDEKFLVSGSKDTTLIVWNLEDSEIFDELLGHEDNVNCVAISYNNKYIVSGSSDNTLKVWSIETLCAREEATIKVHKDEVELVVIIKTQVVSGDSSGVIHIWDLINFTHIHEISVEASILCMAVTNDNRYLVAGCDDCSIRFWSFTQIGEDNEDIFYAHESAVMGICVSSDNEFLVSSSEDASVKIWALSQYQGHKLNITGFKESIYNIDLSPDDNYLVTAGEDCAIGIWDVRGEPVFQRQIEGHEDWISSVKISPNKRFIASASADCTVRLWRYVGDLDSPLKVFEGHSEPINSIAFSLNLNYIISASDDCTLRVWSIPKRQLTKVLEGHTKPVNDVIVTKRYIISGSDDKLVRVWKLKNYSFVKSIDVMYEVSCVCSTQKEKALVVGTDVGVVKIWENWKFSSQHDVKIKAHKGTVTVMKLCSGGENLVTGSVDGTVKIWRFPTESLLITLELSECVTSLTFGNEERYIYVSCKSSIKVYDNPLQSYSVTVYPPEYYSLFIMYLKRLILRSSNFYEEWWKDYLIFPYQANLLHISVFTNQLSLVKKAIKQGVPFIKTCSQETALTISLKRNNIKCADILVNKLCKYILKEKELVLNTLEPVLNQMLVSNLSSLPTLFDYSFPVSSQKLLHFVSPNSKLPIVKVSKTKKIEESNFIKLGARGSELVEYRASLLRVPIEVGSQSSIDFLKSITACEHSEVFRTKFVQSILAYKWSQVYHILLIQTFFYLILLISLSAHSLKDYRSNLVIVYVILGLNVILTLQELIQLTHSPYNYIRDLWNCLDISRIIVNYAYIYCILSAYSGHSNQVLLSVLTALTWTRAIAYFRIFDRTRYLIRMLIEIIIDMIPFLFILFMATIAFSLIFYIVNTEDKSLNEVLLNTYILNYGEFNTDDYNSGEWVVFFIASMSNPLILLTMLVAIMGDTYDKVQEQQLVADSKEMAELVLEAEALLFWSRNKNKKYYLQLCDNVKHEVDNQWMGRIRAIKKSLKELEVKTKSNEKRVISMEKNILDKVDLIMRKNEELQRGIVDLKNDIAEFRTTKRLSYKE